MNGSWRSPHQLGNVSLHNTVSADYSFKKESFYIFFYVGNVFTVYLCKRKSGLFRDRMVMVILSWQLRLGLMLELD